MAEASLRRAKEARAADSGTADLYLDTLGIVDAERRGIVELAASARRQIDPVVSFLVGATSGYMYADLIGKLQSYPIPELRLPAGNGKRLLDIGCSWGRWSVAAARKGYAVTGVDPSLGAVMAARRMARALGADPRFVVADARHLPFQPAAFDIVFSYSVLQHFAPGDTLSAVREVARVLAAGGSSMIQMASAYGIRSLYHQLRRGFRTPDAFDVRYWRPGQLQRVFRPVYREDPFERGLLFWSRIAEHRRRDDGAFQEVPAEVFGAAGADQPAAARSDLPGRQSLRDLDRMCGINGIYAYGGNASPVDDAELLRVRDAMAQRGPDGAGKWVAEDRRLALAHRRLAVIDLSDAGEQPMASPDGRYRITFNGEIYNYRELRATLEAKGRRFRSASDTEVLLQLYEERGPDMLSALRGMYAFAIWDARERRLFLARDPLGIKPLYYADDGATLRFASQVKALLAGGSVSDVLEPAGYAGFFLWGSVPEPYTLYRGIRALPAGHWLAAGPQGAGKPRQFYSLRKVFADAELAAGEGARQSSVDALSAALEDSVRQHLVADVPVGVFLSAGLDSAMLAGAAARRGALHSITLGFDEYRGGPRDETMLAEISAQALGTRHETRWISRRNFQGDIAGVLSAMDQPSIDGLNIYFVAAAACAAGMKVALSGVGGDELFASYPSFRQVPRLAKWLAPMRAMPAFAQVLRRAAAPALRPFTSPKYAGLAEYGGTLAGAYLLRRALLFMPWEISQLLDPDIAAAGLAELGTLGRLNESIAGISNGLAAVSCLEMTWYMRNQLLRDADWAGMAHSLEIRVPLADTELVNCCAASFARGAFPTKREIAGTLCPVLPQAVLERPKTGFTVPVREWLRRGDPGTARGLRGWAGEVFSDFRRDRRALCVIADSFGGTGGIAAFERDFLESLCSDPRYRQVTAVARNSWPVRSSLPRKLVHRSVPSAGLFNYGVDVLREAGAMRRHDVIVCGHLNLLPFAWLAKAVSGAQLVLNIYGVEAWHPSRRWLLERLVGKVDRVVSISRFTFEKFRLWAANAPAQCFLLPCCVDLERFSPGRPLPALAREYGVAGSKVILSLARLNAQERYKGIDEVLEILPRLRERIPGLVYLVAGEGSDVERLRDKSRALGVADSVRFLGYIEESLKPDLYRLADAFVMAGRGEGFGIVYIEALACGVPVVGSRLDASRETLLDGELGILVDPADPDDVLRGIVAALSASPVERERLARYSRRNFTGRVMELGDRLWQRAGSEA